MKLFFCFLLCLSLVFTQGYGQTYFNVKFTIVDAITQKPIEGTYVHILGSNLSSFSDENGLVFINKTPNSLNRNKILLSDFRYKDTILDLTNLSNKIKLTPLVTFLPTVEVLYISNRKKEELKALELIEKTINNLDETLYKNMYSLIGTYTYVCTRENKNDTLRLSNGFSNFALPPILNEYQQRRLKIDSVAIDKDKREEVLSAIVGKQTNIKQLFPLPFDLEYIHFVMLSGNISRSFPLDAKNIKKYNFRIEDTVLVKKQLCYKVAYTPLKLEKNIYEGYILIDTSHCGIVEIKSNLLYSAENKDVTIIAGVKENKKIEFPFYQKDISISFTKEKTRYIVDSVYIKTIYNIMSKKEDIDSDRLIVSYNLTTFKETIDINRKNEPTKKTKTTKLKNKLHKKIAKINKELWGED